MAAQHASWPDDRARGLDPSWAVDRCKAGTPGMRTRSRSWPVSWTGLDAACCDTEEHEQRRNRQAALDIERVDDRTYSSSCVLPTPLPLPNNAATPRAARRLRPVHRRPEVV